MKFIKKSVLMLLTILLVLTNISTIIAEDGNTKTNSDPSATYSAFYDFVLECEGELPDEVMKLLPDTITDLKEGDIITNAPVDDVETDDVIYRFLHWSANEFKVADSDEALLEYGENGFTSNIKLCAQWDEKTTLTYTLTYKLNGGTYEGSTADIIEKHTADEKVYIHAAPTRSGYKFLYWDGSEYYPGQEYTLGTDHVFTAVWQKETTPTPVTPKYNVPKTGID